MLYHLPKAVLPVELVARGGALELRVLPAKQVVDPRKRYYLKHPANVFSSDNVKVEYDSSGLLLSKLTIDSTDETLNILKDVAKATAFGRAEAAAAAGEDILASGDFDPDDSDGLDGRGSNAPLMQDLHAALYRYTQYWSQQCARKDIAEEKDKPTPENCAMANELAPRLANREPILRINATPIGNNESTPEADCTIGLCYRGQQPFALGLEVRGLYSRRTVLMLPNNSPAVALSLDRAPFVKTEHTVEFQTNGTLKSVDTKRPSSALQLVSWPLDVYKAVLNATSELITLRIGAKDNEVKLAQKELDTAKELKRLGDEMEAFRNKKPEGAGVGRSTTSLLSIQLGRMKVDQREEMLPDPVGDDNAPQKINCKAGQPCVGEQGTAGGK